MTRETWKNCLLRVMGDEVWDVQSLQSAFNENWKYGASTNELVNKMRSMAEIEVVGTTSVCVSWIRGSPKSGYKLWAVKPEYRRLSQ